MAEQTRSERLASAYKRLAVSAEGLNAASDEYSKPISELETALQRLNLGLVTWQRVVGGADDDLDSYWRRDVGYAQVEGKWGLAIRSVSGNNHWDRDDIELWSFHDAPRSYRIEALDKLADLLEELVKSADKTAKKLTDKTIEAQELATALKQAVTELEQQRKDRKRPANSFANPYRTAAEVEQQGKERK